MKLLEHWKPVAGYEGFYEVSNVGNVRRLTKAGWNPECRPHKILKGKLGGNQCPRLFVKLCRPEQIHAVYIHHLVAEAFLGECPVGMERNHKNGDCFKNWASNLEFVTPWENKRHAKVAGLMCRGERHRSAKLKVHEVREIRARLASGERPIEIAACYGVTNASIHSIKNGKNWSHVR